MSEQRAAVRGVAASLLASVLFAVIFLLAGLLSSSAEVVFAWRVLLTLACYAAALAHPGARRALRIYGRRLRSRWWMAPLALALAGIVGSQLWIFMWAPQHGQALDASLGYLLLPICLVLGGRLILRSSVNRTQWLVVALAAVAIAVKVVTTPQLGWVTAAICIPYTVYFVTRRRFGLDAPVAFGVEMAALTPLALLLIATAEPGVLTGLELGGLVAIGLASAAAMTLYLGASSLLSLPVFGLLGYVEPVLLVGVALLLGERMSGADGVVYGLLAVALTILAVDGFRAARRTLGV